MGILAAVAAKFLNQQLFRRSLDGRGALVFLKRAREFICAAATHLSIAAVWTRVHLSPPFIPLRHLPLPKKSLMYRKFRSWPLLKR
jgi:hypothetical protein